MKRITTLLILTLLLFGCAQEADDYLVIINGEKIYDEQLSAEIDREIEKVKSKGIYVSSQDEKEIKEKMLESQIRKILLLQEAKKGDYLPSDEKVRSLYQKYLDQVPNGQTSKNFYGVTEEQLFKNITTELQIENYVIDFANKNDMEDELVVTDEEIEVEFEKFKNYIGAGDHMKLEDYYEDVKDVLEDEKLLELRNKIANILMEDSEIVYNS